MTLRDRWRSLPPEQKEAVFLGIHGTVAAAIIYAARKSGIPIRKIITSRPALVVGGAILGTAYYLIVKRFVIEK